MPAINPEIFWFKLALLHEKVYPGVPPLKVKLIKPSFPELQLTSDWIDDILIEDG